MGALTKVFTEAPMLETRGSERRTASRQSSPTFPTRLAKAVRRGTGSVSRLFGIQIPFTHPPPLCRWTPPKTLYKHSKTDHHLIEEEILQLLCKRAIEKVSPHSYGLRSQLFTLPKKTGDRRHVLNLRHLNQYLPRQHFETESLKMACTLINRGDYLTNIDLPTHFYTFWCINLPAVTFSSRGTAGYSSSACYRSACRCPQWCSRK